MTIESRLEVIKNRMGEQFDSQFKYKHSIESFCEQWEEYYKRKDYENSLENECRKEYIWRKHEIFNLRYYEIDKIKWEFYYCGIKDKMRFVSINSILFELTPKFQTEFSRVFGANHSFWAYGNVIDLLKRCNVKNPFKLFSENS
jgi:hypothetical protein